MEGLRIKRGGVDDIPAIRGLWESMHGHHTMLPDAHPTRPVRDSWLLRSAQYERWLETEDAQLLIALDRERPVGYAVVRIMSAPPTWDFGGRVAELESLSVAPHARGRGVGGMLVAAARRAAHEAGATRVLVSVAYANRDALRFYEREGFAEFYVQLIDEGRAEDETVEGSGVFGS